MDGLNIKLTGIETITQNLQKVQIRSTKQLNKALIQCAIKVRQDMVKKAPKIPIDLGNLQASWFVVTVLDTKGSGTKFNGKEAGILASDHSSAISEAKSEVKARRNPTTIMGFSANYAATVHERTSANFAREKKGKKRRVGAGAKFFETHLFSNYQEFLRIMKENLVIK